MAKKKNRKPGAGKQKAKARAAATAATEPTRRDTLKLLRNGALGVAALGGGGYFAVSAVRATAAEMDLTRVGKGKPSVVQVHDPSCPMCTQLQREARTALKCFEECDIVYLVANINGDEGRQFAAQYSVPHVTLLLFDSEGTHVNTLRGVRDSAELKAAFESLRAAV